MLAAANPTGNFPLIDDWAFARSVHNWIETGRPRLSGFVAMTLVGQVAWGAAFAWLLGFSFEALRLSTVLLSLVGLAAMHRLVAAQTGRADLALGAAALLLVNPIYFHLSATFMTDVPFVALALLALLFYLRSLQDGRPASLLAGTAAAALAVSVRQVGLALPLAYAAGRLWRDGVSARVLAAAGLPVAAVALVYLGILGWLAATDGTPGMYHVKLQALLERAGEPLRLLLRLLSRSAQALAMTGLFVAPFLLLVVREARGRWAADRRFHRRLFLLLLVLLALPLIGRHRELPLFSSILFDLGLGVLTTKDVFVLSLPHWPRAPAGFWTAAMAAAVAASALSLTLLGGALRGALRRRRAGAGSAAEAALVAVLAAALLPLLPVLPIAFFDRYLLLTAALLPLALGIALAPAAATAAPSRWDRAGRIAGVAAMLAIGLFSVAATHDHFAMNRARWAALAWLTEQEKVPPERIDGGLEFNAWHLQGRPVPPDAPRDRGPWVHHDDYMVALGPVPGYEPLAAYPFAHWLTLGRREVLVLRKTE